MGYRNLQSCVADLEKSGQLVRVDARLSGRLEVAEVHRRVFASGGPALLFTNVADSPIPLLSNLFGTVERARYLFRDTYDRVRRLVELKSDPSLIAANPAQAIRLLPSAARMRPKRVSKAAVRQVETTIAELPHVVHWPGDGGAFITLPLVYTEDPLRPGPAHSNLGMYRVQLSGGEYRPNQQVGLHYQIHRGIGVHHAAALKSGKQLPVRIYVGGAPAMILSAVMPLPEGLSELTFAGALGGHRIPLYTPRSAELPVYAEADVCIEGYVEPDLLLPEGPFGDHLGYYSLAHPFPVLRVTRVTRRRDAIWPFTVVGRPPQEDTVFGQLIHELTAPVIPSVLPGVKAVHAVDAAGVHPLLLAIGSERYTPYQSIERPQELLTQANAILGQGQMSLAKFLLIIENRDCPDLDINDVESFLVYLLERIDWSRDVHFQTCTTIDTLDYSGTRLHEGSKVVWAAAGAQQRSLQTEVTGGLNIPEPFGAPQVPLPGVLVLQGPCYEDATGAREQVERWCHQWSTNLDESGFPLVVIVDDSSFAGRSLNDFLWVTFTRTDPARDTFGIGAFVRDKHWGCHGPLVLDARLKPQHPPPLEADPEVAKRIDALAAQRGPLAAYL